MNSAPRKTGIAAIPEVPWGTHLCIFYDSVENLLELLPSYFMAGLEQNERCFALATPGVSAKRLEAAMRPAIPHYEALVASGAIQLIASSEIYGDPGQFDRARAVALWRDKVSIADALAAGYAGLRGFGDDAWLESRHWESFSEYEADVDSVVHDEPILLLCAYPVEDRKAADVFTVARNHDIVVFRQEQTWRVLESAPPDGSRLALQAQRAQLQHALIVKEHALASTSAQLAELIGNRARLERELQSMRGRFTAAFSATPLIAVMTRLKDNRLVEINEAFLSKLGYQRHEVLGRTTNELDLWVDPAQRAEVRRRIEVEKRLDGYDLAVKTREGRRLDIVWYSQLFQFDDETYFVSAGHDQTASKKLERELIEQQWLYGESERLSRTGSWRRRGSQVTWSAQMYRLYGQAPERFVPSFEAWLSLIHGDDRERVRVAVTQAARTLGSYDVEHRIALADGAVRYLRSVGYCTRDSGERDRDLVGYSTDVTELREAMEQLRATSRKLVDLREESQRRLAAEIHDGVGQLLTATSMNLETLRSRIPAGDAQSQHRLDDSIALVQRATESVVDILSDLRPSALEELGFVPALERYAAAFQRRTGIDTTVRTNIAPDCLPEDWSTPLFRIVQEGLMNVAKHAGAHHATVQISCIAENLALMIEDDGVGIGLARPSGAPSSGLGLVTSRERVAALGGTFRIGARERGGTRMEIQLPLHKADILTYRRSEASGNS